MDRNGAAGGRVGGPLASGNCEELAERCIIGPVKKVLLAGGSSSSESSSLDSESLSSSKDPLEQNAMSAQSGTCSSESELSWSFV